MINGYEGVRRAMVIGISRLFPLVFMAFAVLLVQLAQSRAFAEDLKQSGTIEIEQVQIAFIGSGNLGGGVLNFQGQKYPFTLGGLGVGGFGISTMTAKGEVYNLADVADFEGAYGQARYGVVVGELDSGELWLENTSGVYIHLKTERVGIALSLGVDAVYIDLD